jgi:glycosyltransferase involved in cell wall biosynthesis
MKTALKSMFERIGTKQSSAADAGSIRTIAVCAAQVPFFRGGAESHVDALVGQLKSRGYEVELINIPYKWYPHAQLLRSMEIWQKLDLSESNGKKIDLVIATKFPSYFIEHPRKVVWLIHQYRQMYDLLDSPYSAFDMGKRRDRKLREKLVAMDTAALASYPRRFSNSQNTADRLLKYNGLEAEVLYHPPHLQGRYKSIDDKGYILSAGRLDKLKRIDLLLQAMPYMSPTIRCKIAGTGPEREELARLARELDVKDRVDFLGFVSDDELIQLYGECSAVFFAPRDEDYGYITLEAFLARKPVITATDSGGPLEFVEHDTNGLVLASLDPEAMGRQIEALVSNRQLCERYGQSGYHRIEHISWEPAIRALVGEQKKPGI